MTDKKPIIIGGKDRDHYRALTTTALIEEVSYGINVHWQELAIALAERLDTKQRKLEGMIYDRDAERSDYDNSY